MVDEVKDINLDMEPPHPDYYCATLKLLPEDSWEEAAEKAIKENPINSPPNEVVMSAIPIITTALGFAAPNLTDGQAGEVLNRLVKNRLALLTQKYWGSDGAELTVGFMESITPELRDRILSHMNAWSEFCKFKFRWTQQLGSAKVRITRGGEGYWSYLGTDILMIPYTMPTMCLQGFTMSTRESEYHRVVRHETGHTMGFPHEHMRPEIVELLDPTKTINWGAQVLGWDAQTVREQILTPIPRSAFRGTEFADKLSIMCYGLPASITRDGNAIPGGNDIDQSDKDFAMKVYPLPNTPPNPPDGGDGGDNGGSSGGWKVNKEQLKAWLVGLAAMLTGISAWLVGPLAKFKVYVNAIVIFLNTVANNDAVLAVIVAILGGQLASALKAKGLTMKPPKVSDLKTLASPTLKQLKEFKEAELEL